MFTCTASMVAPNLALTARHCISDSDASLNCDVAGNATAGGVIRGDYLPADLRFYRGTAKPADVQAAEPDARGARFFHDNAKNLCAHDLALVLLDKPIGTPIATLRLDADAKAGEGARVVGWGLVNDQASDFEATVRQQRDVDVLNIGPLETEQLTLTSADFSVRGESICSGDSGGPVISRDTGAVIGVISHGDNGRGDDTSPPGATCTGPGEYNVMTKLAPFRAVFNDAFAAAGTSPKLEVREDEDGCSCRTSGTSHVPDVLPALAISASLLWALRRRRFAR